MQVMNLLTFSLSSFWQYIDFITFFAAAQMVNAIIVQFYVNYEFGNKYLRKLKVKQFYFWKEEGMSGFAARRKMVFAPEDGGHGDRGYGTGHEAKVYRG